MQCDRILHMIEKHGKCVMLESSMCEMLYFPICEVACSVIGAELESAI